MPTSASYWKTQLADFFKKFGDPPAASAPYSEEQARAALVPKADSMWSYLAASYPDAVRPTDAFVHWANGTNDPDLQACMLAAGAELEQGVDSDGKVSHGFSGPGTMEYEVGSFDCGFVRYPDRPQPPANDAQLGYEYDYLTRFVTPCYVAHGVHVEPAPSRAEFIAQERPGYDGTRWYPLPPNAGDASDPVYDGSNAVCPLSVPWL
jgi:hypothetical protein